MEAKRAARKESMRIIRAGGGGRRSVRGSTGGSDGCINFEDDDNKGLKTCLIKSNIPRIYHEVCDKMSLADFLVVSAEAMMARTGKAFNKKKPFGEGSLESNFMKNFFFGRKTAQTCNETGLMPNPEKGCNDINDIFNKHIFWRRNGERGKYGHKYWNQGSWKDSTTLMGVHTIGRAHLENSGYTGPWTSSPGVFDNGYYREQLTNGWGPVANSPKKHQWNLTNAKGPRNLMMLNTDVCLAWNLNKPHEKCMEKHHYSRRSQGACNKL